MELKEGHEDGKGLLHISFSFDAYLHEVVTLRGQSAYAENTCYVPHAKKSAQKKIL